MNQGYIQSATRRKGILALQNVFNLPLLPALLPSLEQHLAHNRTLSCPLLKELMLNYGFSLLRGKYLISKSSYDQCQLHLISNTFQKGEVIVYII